MKISNGYDSYNYQQTKTQNTDGDTGFSDMLEASAKATGEETVSEKTEGTTNTTAQAAADTNVNEIFEQMTSQSAVNRPKVEDTSTTKPSDDKVEDTAKTLENSRAYYSIAAGQGVDTTRRINEEATGEATLTPEQIEMLSEKYDVDNLTPQQQYDLLCDLTDMNAISAEDVYRSCMRIAPTINNLANAVAVPADNVLLPSIYNDQKQPTLLESLTSGLQQERDGYAYMLELSRDSEKFDKLSDKEKEIFSQNKDFAPHFEAMIDSHQKLANVLSLLLRNNKSTADDALKNYGPNAPEEVKDAWTKAAEETGYNPNGTDENGKVTHITQLYLQASPKAGDDKPAINGNDVLGSSVSSARDAVSEMLAALEEKLKDPTLTQKESYEKEKSFYQAFLNNLDE